MITTSLRYGGEMVLLPLISRAEDPAVLGERISAEFSFLCLLVFEKVRHPACSVTIKHRSPSCCTLLGPLIIKERICCERLYEPTPRALYQMHFLVQLANFLRQRQLMATVRTANSAVRPRFLAFAQLPHIFWQLKSTKTLSFEPLLHRL